MQSALIVHSKSTEEYAHLASDKFKNVEYYLVSAPPDENVINMRTGKQAVLAIGGGSVIDTAKIMAGPKRCIAIPTTAAGAAVTPWAVVWTKNRKITIPTRLPKLCKDYLGLPKLLPPEIRNYTMFDCIAHAIDSLWSKNATKGSNRHARKALNLIKYYLNDKNVNILIEAGNEAGYAIAITGTNLIHALSYPLTLNYGIAHGLACGIVFGVITIKEPIRSLLPPLIYPVYDFDKEKLIKEARTYDKLNDCIYCETILKELI